MKFCILHVHAGSAFPQYLAIILSSLSTLLFANSNNGPEHTGLRIGSVHSLPSYLILLHSFTRYKRFREASSFPIIYEGPSLRNPSLLSPGFTVECGLEAKSYLWSHSLSSVNSLLQLLFLLATPLSKPGACVSSLPFERNLDKITNVVICHPFI